MSSASVRCLLLSDLEQSLCDAFFFLLSVKVVSYQVALVEFSFLLEEEVDASRVALQLFQEGGRCQA